MTQKERLVELLIGQPLTDLITPHEYHCAFISKKDAEDLADHLLNNGVIVPPCWIGDTIYEIYGDVHHEYIVEESVGEKVIFEWNEPTVFEAVDDDGEAHSFYDYSVGYSIFLSREEAEQALKEREA